MSKDEPIAERPADKLDAPVALKPEEIAAVAGAALASLTSGALGPVIRAGGILVTPFPTNQTAV